MTLQFHSQSKKKFQRCFDQLRIHERKYIVCKEEHFEENLSAIVYLYISNLNFNVNIFQIEIWVNNMKN